MELTSARAKHPPHRRGTSATGRDSPHGPRGRRPVAEYRGDRRVAGRASGRSRGTVVATLGVTPTGFRPTDLLVGRPLRYLRYRRNRRHPRQLWHWRWLGYRRQAIT